MKDKTYTCEQFVIEYLLKSREQIDLLQKENNDLKVKIEDLKSNECLATDRCEIYYHISETSYPSDFDKLSRLFSLEDIKNAVELAEQYIFEDLDKIRKRDLGYITFISMAEKKDYTHLIMHGGYKFVIHIFSNKYGFDTESHFIDNECYFLEEEKAIKQARIKAIENLKKYIKWYEEKHKEEEE